MFFESIIQQNAQFMTLKTLLNSKEPSRKLLAQLLLIYQIAEPISRNDSFNSTKKKIPIIYQKTLCIGLSTSIMPFICKFCEFM